MTKGEEKFIWRAVWILLCVNLGQVLALMIEFFRVALR